MTKLWILGVAVLALAMLAPEAMARGAARGGMRGAVVGGMAGGSEGAKKGAKAGVVVGATRGAVNRSADRRAMDMAAKNGIHTVAFRIMRHSGLEFTDEAHGVLYCSFGIRTEGPVAQTEMPPDKVN